MTHATLPEGAFTQTHPMPLGAGTAFESAYVFGRNKFSGLHGPVRVAGGSDERLMAGRVARWAVALLVLPLVSCSSSTAQSSELAEWCGKAFYRLAALPALQGVVSFPAEGDGFSAYSSEYRSLAGAPGGLKTQLVSLADLADLLQAEVKEGASGEMIANGSAFSEFVTKSSDFAQAFDEVCPASPSSSPGTGATLSDQIGAASPYVHGGTTRWGLLI